jgi:alpha-1,3-rhamnosyl/mannosyltransferase
VRLAYDQRIRRYPPGSTAVYADVIRDRMAGQRSGSWDVVAIPGWPRLERNSRVFRPLRRIGNLALDLGWVAVGGAASAALGGVDAWFAPAVPLPATLRVPSVVIMHGIDYVTQPELYDKGFVQVAPLMARMTARRATRIAVPSEYVRQIVIERFSVAPDRVTTIRWGLNHLPPPLAERQHPRPYALTVGQTQPLWNIDVLLDAWRAGAAGDLDLVISGPPGREDHRIKDRVAREGLADRVRFMGTTPSPVLMALMRDAEIFVYPAMADDRGMAPLEAMLFGVPTAVSNRAAMAEVTQGAAAIFDPGNPDEVIETVRRLREDNDLRARLRRDGPPVGRRLRWDDAAAAFWRELDLAREG